MTCDPLLAPIPERPRRFSADHLITSESAHDGSLMVFSPGVVDVADGRVVWSGHRAAAPHHDGEVTVIDGLAMPGLVNCHAHTPMVLLRGAGEGLPTGRWLTEVMWPREAEITGDDVYYAMQCGAAEMLRNGITTSAEMYFHGDDLARGAAAAGLRCIVAMPVIEAADFAKFGTVSEQLRTLNDLRQRWHDHPTIEIAAGPHSVYALSESALEAVAESVAADPMLVHIHVAEQPDEAATVEARTGLTVPAYLDQLDLLGTRTLAAHAVWLTPDDIALFAERGTAVAHCPSSNGRHASGIAPISALRAAGVKVGIGTDGPVSHDRLDLFEDVRTAARFARIKEMNASEMTATDLFAMITSEAADAIGRPDLGRLVPGSRADMIAIDIRSDGFDPAPNQGDLIGRVVWAGNSAAVTDVWVEGRHVVKGGECIDHDRDAVRAKMLAAANRIAH